MAIFDANIVRKYGILIFLYPETGTREKKIFFFGIISLKAYINVYENVFGTENLRSKTKSSLKI